MEARAVARYVRVSPRKARLVVDLIRGKSVGEARQSEVPPARPPRSSRRRNSAVANAERNLHVRADDLFVGATYVDEGPTLKRIQPRAMGRAFRINKRTSHITVIVTSREEA
jgi:large subunit ribosomal protein L22